MRQKENNLEVGRIRKVEDQDLQRCMMRKCRRLFFDFDFDFDFDEQVSSFFSRFFLVRLWLPPSNK